MGLVLPALRALLCHAVPCCTVLHGPPPSLTCVSCPGPSPDTWGYCFEFGSHRSGLGDDEDMWLLCREDLVGGMDTA